MKPTPEQQAAADTFTTGGDMVIQAGAGTGKTSTLKLLAATKPSLRGLYIAYNRAIKEDAARSFPRSVRCVTSHGLAYGTVGRRYRHRLNAPRQTAQQAARVLGITQPLGLGSGVPPLAPAQLTRIVLRTVNRFCHSADELGEWHAPRILGYTPAQQAALAAEALPHARRAWADIESVDGGLKFAHDHYLKLWAMSAPRLDADYILWDEAQDANGVMTGLILGQGHAQRVAVGDSAQAIYGWRGAHDALARFPGDQLTLSQSFRFGPAIADEANQWLDLLDAPLRLTGYDAIDSRIRPLARPAAVLCRTNAGAMAAAMEHMADGLRVAIVGGGAAIKQLAYAALDLRAGRATDHPELLAFTSWDQVRDYARTEHDGGDLLPLVKLIDDHGPDAVIQAADALSDERTAHIVVSTAHKAKGREWATVRIHDDFHKPRPEPDGRLLIRRDEAMLAYVAVTRAREVLDQAGLEWVVELDGTTAQETPCD